MSLENTLKAFCARLDEIEAHQEFIDTSLKVGREASKFWDRAALAHESGARTLVEGHGKCCKIVRLEDLWGALSVQVFAAFEWFIGQLLVKAVRQAAESVASFDKLPEAVLRNHITLTGRALARVYEAPSHERVDVNQVYCSLSGCVRDSTSFELSDYIFAFYLPNMDAKSLEKCLLRIGLKLDWDRIGESKDLQALLGSTSSRKTGNACIEFLDQFAKTRNSVAHNGDGSVSVRVEDLSGQLTFLRHFSSSLVQQATTHLNDIK
jgi:hypothetical protein